MFLQLLLLAYNHDRNPPDGLVNTSVVLVNLSSGLSPWMHSCYPLFSHSHQVHFWTKLRDLQKQKRKCSREHPNWLLFWGIRYSLCRWRQKKIFPVKSQVQVCSWHIFRRLPTGSIAPLSRRRHESDWIRTGRVLFCPSASFFRIQLVTSQRCISRIWYSAAGLRNEIAARSIPSSNLKRVKFRLAVLSECVLPLNYHTKLPESVMKNIWLPKSCDLTWFAKN